MRVRVGETTARLVGGRVGWVTAGVGVGESGAGSGWVGGEVLSSSVHYQGVIGTDLVLDEDNTSNRNTPPPVCPLSSHPHPSPFLQPLPSLLLLFSCPLLLVMVFAMMEVWKGREREGSHSCPSFHSSSLIVTMEQW